MRELVIFTNSRMREGVRKQGSTGKGLVAANAIHAQRAAKRPGQAD